MSTPTEYEALSRDYANDLGAALQTIRELQDDRDALLAELNAEFARTNRVRWLCAANAGSPSRAKRRFLRDVREALNNTPTLRVADGAP